MGSRAFAAVAIIIGLLFVFGVSEAHRAAIVHAALATSVAGLLSAANFGLGRTILRRVAPSVAEGPAGWAFASGIGIGAMGAIFSLLAALGAFALAPVLAIAAGSAALALFGKRSAPIPRSLSARSVALLLILAIPTYVLALAPPIDTDEIYQHLALARRIAENGAFVGGFDTPEGSRPQLIPSVLAGAWLLGGASAARLWHLGVVGVLLLAVAELAAVRVGPRAGVAPILAAATSYTFLHEAGLAYNDIPTALFLLLAAELFLRSVDSVPPPISDSGGSTVHLAWSHAGLFGAFLGLAVTSKFTAGPVAAALGAVFFANLASSSIRRALPHALIAACAALSVLLPWLLRNELSGLHPVFPYAGWPAIEGFRFVYPEKYGVGHTWANAVRLPFDMFFRAKTDSFVFLGQLSYAWAFLLPAAGIAAVKRKDTRYLLALCCIGFVVWANTAQVFRYLLPIAGIAMLAASAAPWPKFAWLFAVLSIPNNVGPVLVDAKKAFSVAVGKESSESYLSREMPAWPALSYLREYVPAGDRVALLYAWQDYWVRQPTILGSVEDHTPTRQWISAHGDRALADLYERGVRWLLVGDGGFLRKTYLFLPDEAFRSQFVEPRERLDRLLLRDASRQFDEGHWTVWRLDDPGVRD